MLIKWIRCKVPPGQQTMFSDAQAQWSDLHGTAGFLGQAGGWSNQDSTEACIISFWETFDDYQNFMQHIHDSIFNKAQQKQTYESISVTLFDQILNINQETVAGLLANAQFLRIAECEVYQGREAHFVRKQQYIWNPGMRNSPGMLGGYTGKSHSGDPRFLVVSFWTRKALHETYVKERLPALQMRAQMSEDLAQLAGSAALLEPEWSVV